MNYNFSNVGTQHAAVITTGKSFDGEKHLEEERGKGDVE